MRYDIGVNSAIILSGHNGYRPFTGSVGVRDGRILRVAKEEIAACDCEDFIDGDGKILMPGLVNGHCHGDMTLARGMGDNMTLCEQNEAFGKSGWFYRFLTDEDRFYSRQLTYCEALLSGTTFLMENMYWGLPALSVRAMKETGIRGALAENTWRVKRIQKLYKTTPIRYLFENGFLGPDTIASHVVYASGEEISELSRAGVKVVSTPVCEMKIQDGIAPVPQMVRAGVNVCLGTDGAMWNNTNDLFREMKGMSLLHSIHSGVKSLTKKEILDMATAAGARAFGLEKDYGAIEEGKKADFILIETKSPHMIPTRTGEWENVTSNVIYNATGRDVKDVVVDGKHVVKGGFLNTADVPKIMEKVQAASEKLAAAKEASGEAAPAEGNLKVALVVNQKFGDKASMDDLAKGADQAAADFGVEIKKLESAEASKFEEDVRAMSKAGYNLIVTTYPYMTDATKLVAKEYPDTKYAAIFQNVNDGDEKIGNIWDTEFHGEQAFYLGGYIAGKLTESNRVGFIVGAEEPTPNAEGNGFMRGVKASNPDAAVEFAYVGSYEDPAKAKEIASAMISKGYDVLQTDSGASNAGVVEASKDAGVLCAGEITDYYDTYDGFYGIEGIGFGDTVYKAIEMLQNGEFPGGEHGIRDLSNGGYFMDWDSFNRFADANQEFGGTMKSAIEKARELEKQLIDGSLKIPFDTEVPNWERIKAAAE